jgi:integrase/recombinase XerD
MNEVKSLLRSEGRMTKRDERVLKPDDFLFPSPQGHNQHYSENRLRQVFQTYVRKAGLDRCYGSDVLGRKLHQITVHSLRHAHIMTYIYLHKLPLPVVQKQVGHRTLRATSVYLRPSDEAIAEAYESVRPNSVLSLAKRSPAAPANRKL